jgi:CRP-like cAMP-binding protein
MDSLDRTKTLALLRQGPWFGALDTELQDSILERCRRLSRRAGTVLYSQGASVPGLFALVEGQIAVTRWVDPDREVLLHVGDPGLWFGEISVLTGKPSLVAVAAHTDVRLLLLPIQEIERIVAEDPRRYRDFARLAIERYAMLVRRSADTHGLAPEDLLVSRLDEIVGLRQAESLPGQGLEISVTQAQLAEVLGLSRQTVNELLHRLQARGLVEVRFKGIWIPDPERLRRRHPEPRVAEKA